MIRLFVDNRVRFAHSELTDKAFQSIAREFEHSNPIYYKRKNQGFWPGASEPKKYITWELGSDGMVSVPRGGYRRLVNILTLEGISYVTSDQRELGRRDGEEIPFEIDLYDYQERCVMEGIRTENCIIECPTGGGKTISAIALAARLRTPSLVVLHRGNLCKQWNEEIEKVTGLKNRQIGIIRAGKYRLRPITIGMFPTLRNLPQGKWDEINSYFGCVIVDECHHVSASTFLEVVDRVEAKYRIGLSADHTRSDGKHFLVEDMFGPVAAKVTREELVNRKFIHDVDVTMVETEYEDPIYLSQQEACKKAKKGVADYGSMIERMTTNYTRDDAIVRMIQDLSIQKKRVLVFTNRIEHVNNLVAKLGLSSRASVATGRLIGGTEYEKEFSETVEGLKSGSIRVGIGTISAMGEGTNIPSVDRGIVTVPVQSRQLWNQIKGRICRTDKDKPDAGIDFMFDYKIFGDQHLQNMKRWNNSVQVRTISDGIMEINEFRKSRERRSV